jgi:hypothetical protein
MKTFFPFPSIGQFANAIRHVSQRTRYSGKDKNGDPVYNNAPLPTIEYRGTVKMHGTNAAIVYDPHTQDLAFQSRERTLTLEQDNAGFMLSMLGKQEKILEMMDVMRMAIGMRVDPARMVVFGEWCGGSIQKSVALNAIPKMFVIFGVKVIPSVEDGTEENNLWIDLDWVKHITLPDDGIHNILNFPTYEMEIDFENPHRVQNDIVELVNKVEAQCPVAMAFFKEFNGFVVNQETVDSLPIQLRGECQKILQTETEFTLSF